MPFDTTPQTRAGSLGSSRDHASSADAATPSSVSALPSDKHGGRVRFAGWVEPGDDPEPITQRHFRVLIECDTPAAFDGLSLNVVWNAIPVRVVRCDDALIAAAPELLAMLDEWIAPYEDITPSELFATLPTSVAQRIVNSRAALAMATGQ